jgi:alkanesulfonate monooxygenase SsuD/methylene tetrahydromethanopterin reductase-like flavin-dependent oxidoreductase (luciferase family)
MEARARQDHALDIETVSELRVGVQLPEVEREVRWPELLAIARRAEAAGFDSLWVGDHMLYRDDGRPERGPWDVWTVLAALAASTERVRLGPLVASTAFHPPGLIARMAATIDEVAGGRFVLGLGAGWNETEFRAFGIPFDSKVSRFEEAFTIIRRLLTGERVTFEGRFCRVEDAVLLPRPHRSVPLMVGSAGPRVLGIASPHVDWWNCWYSWYGNTPDGFAELSARFEGGFHRSACVLVGVDGGAGERPLEEAAPPVEPAALAEHLDALAEAGADEAILVLDPIDERSVAAVADALDLRSRFPKSAGR